MLQYLIFQSEINNPFCRKIASLDNPIRNFVSTSFCLQMSLLGMVGIALAKPAQFARYLSTTSAACSMGDRYKEGSPFRRKIDFGPFRLFNKRHLREHKKLLFLPNQRPNKHPEIPIHRYGSRVTGVRHHAMQEHIPEMVPELIVPGKWNCVSFGIVFPSIGAAKHRGCVRASHPVAPG